MDRFLKQISPDRWMWIIFLVFVLVGCAWADFESDTWDQMPFVTNLVSGVVLLLLAIVLVDEYLSFRAARSWERLAAFALEDLGRICRAAWTEGAKLLGAVPVQMRVEQLRQQIRSPEGQHQLREGAEAFAADLGNRLRLHDELHKWSEATRAALMEWAPVMVTRQPARRPPERVRTGA